MDTLLPLSERRIELLIMTLWISLAHKMISWISRAWWQKPLQEAKTYILR